MARRAGTKHAIPAAAISVRVDAKIAAGSCALTPNRNDFTRCDSASAAGIPIAAPAKTSPAAYRPTSNITDDMTWSKGRHTITYGVNLRFAENDNQKYSNSYPSYSFSRNTLLGLGADLTTDITN